MVFNTATVGSAVAPAVVETFLSHYLNRKPQAQKPTSDISYDEGLHLIRQFLLYASHHTVEDIQRFTAQWVPHPRWVKVDHVTIDPEHTKAAAEAIQAQLGHHGVEKVGGKTWWQWRRPGSELKAEWIEMRSDFQERKRLGQEKNGTRVMLYVHGGAYFFGSVDEHRYQMQRHARKLKARVFARLLVVLRDRGLPLPAGAILISPWVDLTHSFPSVAGDNPMDYIPPHGFHQRPSAAWPPPNSDDMLAMAESAVKKLTHDQHALQSAEDDAVQGFHVNEDPNPGTENDDAATGTATNDGTGPKANTVPGPGHELSIMLDGQLIDIKDQIQMYATNQMISHPLVSPILQPSLGGLPPLLILTGGGEALRDEQIYLAHKAANPAKYPPGDAFLDENPNDHNRNQIGRWKPTDVQLQVWDDLCHVAPTLSFTRPAKYMYRSIAQFGAWALARAQHTEIEIMDDDDVSVISDSDTESDSGDKEKDEGGAVAKPATKLGQVGKAGDPLPPFKNHMIRQRVDRHGAVYPLGHASTLPGCNLQPGEIGVIKEGPVRKWMTAKKQWDTKFASSKRRVQKQRAKEMMEGYQTFGDGEVPPPSALVGRRRKGDQHREEKNKRSWGMSLWSLWGSKHDEKTMEREEQADKEAESVVVTEAEGANARPLDDTETKQGKDMADQKQQTYSRSRSRRRTVTDQHQTDQPENVDENTTMAELLARKGADEGLRDQDKFLFPFPPAEKPAKDATAEAESKVAETEPEAAEPKSNAASTEIKTTIVDRPAVEKTPAEIPLPQTPVIIETPPPEPPSTTIEISKTNRPKSNGIAFPFRLGRNGNNKSNSSLTSTTTLTSTLSIHPPDDIREGNNAKPGVALNAKDKKALEAAKNGAKGKKITTWPKKAESSDNKAIGKEKKNATWPKKVEAAESKSVAREKKPIRRAETDRPALESFVTASEDLPKPGFAGLDYHKRNASQASVRDYVTW